MIVRVSQVRWEIAGPAEGGGGGAGRAIALLFLLGLIF